MSQQPHQPPVGRGRGVGRGRAVNRDKPSTSQEPAAPPVARGPPPAAVLQPYQGPHPQMTPGDQGAKPKEIGGGRGSRRGIQPTDGGPAAAAAVLQPCQVPRPQMTPGDQGAKPMEIGGGRGSRRGIQPTDGDLAAAALASGLKSLALSEPARTVPPPAVGRGSTRGGRELPCTLRTRPASVAGSKKGITGHVVKFQSNYFKVLTHTQWRLHQYRVDFKPEEDRTAIKKALLRVHRATLGGYIFDGSMLFTTAKYSTDPLELCSKRASDDENIKISVRWVSDLDRGDVQYLQFFNILTRKCLEHLKLQLVGRDYYDPAGRIDISQYKLELWPGYMTSIRQHEDSILLCSEISHKVMRKESVLHFYVDCTQKNPRNYQAVFTNAIVGTIVLTSYNNKTYRVDDVDFEHTPMDSFDMKGKQVCYVDYFRDRYGLNVADKRQPLLISRPKMRDVRAGKTGNIVLIPELCRLTGITDEMRNNFQMMKAMGEYTRVGPEGRIQKLRNFSRRLQETPAIKEDLNLWSMKFSPDLLELSGRILPPEHIVQRSKRGDTSAYETGVEADWTKNMRNNVLFNGGELSNWAAIFDGRTKREIQNLIDTLTRAMSNLGFAMKPPMLKEMRGDRVSDYCTAIEECISQINPQILLIIVPNNRGERYAAIKKKCYIDRSVPCQVVTAAKMRGQGLMSIATKIGIQMSCKIGGSPWTVELPLKNLMVVGYDACHDSHSKGRTYGAMVASIDQSLTRYFSTVSHHSSGEELSNDIALNLVRAVQRFKKYNGQFPSRIIFYRDGVGEGQIPFVHEIEVKAILEELRKVYGEEPKMAFVIVSKRINTRFFLGGRNPPPGAVVDDVVTLPDRYDFFLVSQSVRQGTVSPTSYNVIYDTSGLTPDKMQRLTYKMTHLYYNWSGTVRVPAQCQYAHKLAFLVGQSIHHIPNNNLSELLYYL